jgi:hypothetical protein
MNIEKIHSKIKFILLYTWTIIILAQVLKTNFSYIYFPIFFSIFFVICIFIFQKGFFFKGVDIFTLQIWIFYFLIIYIGAITFLHGDFNDFLKAFPRMVIMPLSFIVFINLISSKEHFQKLIDLILFFSIVAAFSLIYQVYNGPFGFLVENHTRLGLDRYASTFGSLTIYGAVVGIITLLVVKKDINIILKFLIITLFLTSAFVSLAKAALLNILIVTFFSIFFLKIKNSKFILIFLILFGTALIFFVFPELRIYIIKSIESLGFKPTGEIDMTSNSSFFYQFTKRFFYSVDYLSYFNIKNLFFGFGLIGGQGVFGLPYSFTGTTHNQFMDLFLIGGVFLFLNIILLVICTMLELNKIRNKDPLAETFFFCNMIAIINMFFFNGFIYQPVTSIVFWLSIVYVLNFRANNYKKGL